MKLDLILIGYDTIAFQNDKYIQIILEKVNK